MNEQESRDKLLTQYKIAVLYLLDATSRPLSTSQICDVLLDRLFTNFFNLQLSLSQLIDTGFVDKGEPNQFSYYAITPDGKDALKYLLPELALDMRREILSRVQSLHLDQREAIVPSADWGRSATGGSQVHLKLMEGNAPVVDLTLQVPGNEAARHICESWARKSQQVYEALLEELI